MQRGYIVAAAALALIISAINPTYHFRRGKAATEIEEARFDTLKTYHSRRMAQNESDIDRTRNGIPGAEGLAGMSIFELENRSRSLDGDKKRAEQSLARLTRSYHTKDDSITYLKEAIADSQEVLDTLSVAYLIRQATAESTLAATARQAYNRADITLNDLNSEITAANADSCVQETRQPWVRWRRWLW